MSHFQIMDESAADGEVAEVFDEIKRVMEIPFVPNILKSQGLSASALKGTWGALSNVFLRTNLPMSLASMILYSIAAARNCEYCSAVHKMTCRTVGIDEDTLAALEKDLEALAPRRGPGRDSVRLRPHLRLRAMPKPAANISRRQA